MNITNKKIGIWGLGIVGKSAVRFFRGSTDHLTVMDKKNPSADDSAFLKTNHVSFITENEQTRSIFFSNNDLIFASPGIDVRDYHSYKDKFLNELDLFQEYCHKPTIAVTGTVGKTSVTHLLTKCLQLAGKKVLCGGNIGIGMLDLLEQTADCDYVILELSSFQLSKAQYFAPDLALVTNIYPNHLDWHVSMQEYIEAKLSMIRRQRAGQKAFVPPEVVKECNKHLIALPEHLQICPPRMIRGDLDVTFNQNWQMICTACVELQIPVPPLQAINFDQTIKEHRLELVDTINGIDFYNDSKSTISQSTFAAVTQLSAKPILLILGGVNKAADKKADRIMLLEQLPQTVKFIASFGCEAELIANVRPDLCTPVATLKDAVRACYSRASAGDQIILSPGGSSYDMYANYKERGTDFKKIIWQIISDGTI